jgi:hypothetical protein
MNKIFLIGFLALGYLGYKKYILAKKVNINLKDFGFNGGTFLEPIINVKLEVENPTSTTTDLQKITGEILLQNNIVGTVYQDINQKILSNQKTVINFNVKLNLKDAAIILIENKFKNQNLIIKGNLMIDFIFIPFNYTVKLP